MAPPKKSTIRAHYDIEDAIEHLYDVTLLEKTIFTTVTEDPAAVTNWINTLNNAANVSTPRYIGVAAELYSDSSSSSSSSSDDDNNNNNNKNTRIGTFQFCDGKNCLVYHLVNVEKDECPPALVSFLGKESYGFVGMDILAKMKMLGEHFSFVVPPMVTMDLCDVAMTRFVMLDLMNASQSELSAMTLGVTVEMPEVDDGGWGYPGKLSDEQVHYACIEAFLNLEIGRWLNNPA